MVEKAPEIGKTIRPAVSIGGSVASFYDGTVSLTCGHICAQSTAWESEPLTKGLKLVVVDNSELLCKLPNCEKTRIVGPCICAIWNESDCEGMQSFPAGSRMQFTAISLSASTVKDRLPTAFERLSDASKGASGPSLAVTSASAAVRALCAQVGACPLRGLSRTLYLSGKALEIAAHALDSLQATPSNAKDLHFSTADIEKLQHARDILTARMRQPPSLAELGQSVGLNPRKLTVGFRRVFGDSVFGYLRSAKLDAAYRLLVEGEMSVSCAAYSVGYSPAHFSVAFRKKFGVSPKQVCL
ncbi:helix-turn-helix domain-containing protein [Azospirillum lipoferum]|uniref:Regulatory protein Pchr (AraC family) n=1 Tax=Azospirillum lipoferum (strain 4B) TaxID=862719 RepID=G7ZD65_AZOL4|nr:AraC family transcriptional regulator [Azospirillum lipoferum]CBS89332.1 regulatory protein Pchr (AraC family) [Azospirillum lipoferum 4B]